MTSSGATGWEYTNGLRSVITVRTQHTERYAAGGTGSERPQDAAGIPDGDDVGRDVAQHHASGPDDRVVAHCHARPDDRARPDPDVPPDEDRQRVLEAGLALGR